MNVPNLGIEAERVLPEGGTRSTTRPSLLTWQGDGVPSMESVRLLVSEGRLRALGRLISAADPEAGTDAFSASFEASVKRSDNAGRLLLRANTADEERQVSISRTEDGVWLIDHGTGEVDRDEFAGAHDVDLAGAVTFNALPIRRLGLHREPGEHTLTVLYVSLPDLAISVVEQTYRTVSVAEDTAVVNFAHGEFSADLTIDSHGLVIDYPGVAHRV